MLKVGNIITGSSSYAFTTAMIIILQYQLLYRYLFIQYIMTVCELLPSIECYNLNGRYAHTYYCRLLHNI